MSKGLGEIAERLTLVPDLLGEQAKMICVSQHLLEQVARSSQTFLIGGAGARQSFHQPERAEIEGALSTLQTVRCLFDVIAEYQAIGDQAAIARRPIDGVDGF